MNPEGFSAIVAILFRNFRQFNVVMSCNKLVEVCGSFFQKLDLAVNLVGVDGVVLHSG
jgi:hypothetical protein